MQINEREVTIPACRWLDFCFGDLRASLECQLRPHEIPVRFVIIESGERNYACETAVVSGVPERLARHAADLFAFRRRKVENTLSFNAVLLIPTGIGAEIGGHAGDATAVARLLAQTCDALVLHPNVVNASDINELPENAFYVEGSLVTRLLMGTVGLSPSRSNRILVILDDHMDRHFVNFAINSVNAARATYGLHCTDVVCLNPPIRMFAEYSKSGRAIGRVEGLNHCLELLDRRSGHYDAVAISSVIRVPHEYHLKYFASDGKMVNPWGGVEAMLTHAISSLCDVHTAHSPMFESKKVENLEVGIVEPRMAAEAVSVSFLQCVLKGLHSSPRIVRDQSLFARSDVFSVEDVSCLIIPDGCLGLPTIAALLQGISVIAVRENLNLMKNDLSRLPWQRGQFIRVDNYLEAAGVMNAMKAGVTLESVRRPIRVMDVTRETELPEDTSRAVIV